MAKLMVQVQPDAASHPDVEKIARLLLELGKEEHGASHIVCWHVKENVAAGTISPVWFYGKIGPHFSSMLCSFLFFAIICYCCVVFFLRQPRSSTFSQHLPHFQFTESRDQLGMVHLCLNVPLILMCYNHLWPHSLLHPKKNKDLIYHFCQIWSFWPVWSWISWGVYFPCCHFPVQFTWV